MFVVHVFNQLGNGEILFYMLLWHYVAVGLCVRVCLSISAEKKGKNVTDEKHKGQ